MTGFFNIGDRVSVYVENMQMWVDGVVFNRMKGIYSIEVDGKKIVVGRENLKQASRYWKLARFAYQKNHTVYEHFIQSIQEWW